MSERGTAGERRRGFRGWVRRRRWPMVAALILTAIIWGAAAHAGHRAGEFLMEDQPSTRDLEHHVFNLSSKVYDSEGELIYKFAQERRDYVAFEDMSPYLIQALVAVEDEQFWDHFGLNFHGIARAAITDAKASLEAGRLVFPEGGSSLTQQLAKQLFLSGEKKFSRKIQEALLALHIEKDFEKEEILELYLNHVFLGHQRYGVEAAASYYFGKSASDLSLPEAALLAGLPQRPSAYSPRSNPDAALRRRNHVLDRMAAAGYVTPEVAAEAKATPLELTRSESRRRMRTRIAAPFFVEDVRRQLVEEHGDLVNTGGLEVETTLDMELQRVATRAVRDGLRRLDKELRGFQPIAENVLETDDENTLGEVDSLADFEHPLWLVPPEVDDVVPGLVTAVSVERATVRIGEVMHEIGRDAIAWTDRRDLDRVFRRGDVAPFRLLRNEEGETTGLELEQHPRLEAALVAIDVASGEVVAMVGGYDYDRSEFNKASQARRQVGSAFKPFYYAAAFEQGMTPATTVVDEPSAFVDPWTGAVYAPKNYHHSYGGRVTLREALQRSLNIASVKLLNVVGYDRVIELSRQLGIEADLQPYPSLALGAQEMTLLELTSAYAGIANLGLHVEPTLIRAVRDAKGNLVGRSAPSATSVLSAESAFQATHLLRGVIQNGTGKRARKLGVPLAGKTGTTDDYSNAWFVGYSPSLAVGVWVGHEESLEPIGRGYSGAKAALPIWIDFVGATVDPENPEPFPSPPGIDFIAIDEKTGLLASEACPKQNVFLEAFKTGERPARRCAAAQHEQLALPQCLQHFPIDESGVLIADESDLFRLEGERAGCGVVIDPIRRVIELPWAAGGTWSAERGGLAPRTVPYRPRSEVWGGGYRRDSVEQRMANDPRELRRTQKAGLRDFDVIDGGMTVVMIRNDG